MAPKRSASERYLQLRMPRLTKAGPMTDSQLRASAIEFFFPATANKEDVLRPGIIGGSVRVHVARILIDISPAKIPSLSRVKPV